MGYQLTADDLWEIDFYRRQEWEDEDREWRRRSNDGFEPYYGASDDTVDETAPAGGAE
jgi:hypothetical protein